MSLETSFKVGDIIIPKPALDLPSKYSLFKFRVTHLLGENYLRISCGEQGFSIRERRAIRVG